MRIEIPETAVVALIGASSSGKTTFAKKHFLPTEILSSDFFRGMVSDDENNQIVSSDAFDLLYYAANKRLSNMKTAVIDATNVRKEDRKKIIETAKAQNLQSVAIVLNLPEKILKARNEARTERNFPERVIHRHVSDLKRSIKHLRNEGFRYVYVLNSQEDIDNVEIVRTRIWSNKRDEHGPFDIIGDIHGCYDELHELLLKLGYEPDSSGGMLHPQGRKAAFLGDLCDRGPNNVKVIKLVMAMVKSGNALCVAGNHDVKLLKRLMGRNVKMQHGLDTTSSEMDAENEEFKTEVREFLNSLVSHYMLDDGKLAIAHAGVKEEFQGRASGRVKEFCLYGETTGETDEYGLPVRLDWTLDYRGNATVVYGHVPQVDVQVTNNTFGIDTGCVFGGALTAFRYPERQIVQVKAEKQYYEPIKPLSSPDEPNDGMLKIEDVQGRIHINTRLMPSITIGENNTASALETMSRFAADPHWLIYLPPTMSPCETSGLDEYLEHPAEAFEYYSSHGITNVLCEKKHMGSRAIIVLCRNVEAAAKRFGTNENKQGIIYTRTGRQFFKDQKIETEILQRLTEVLDKSGFWNDFSTDWVCLDTELMPWSEKAQGLLIEQYAPVGRAGKESTSAAVKALQMTCQRENIEFDVDAEVSGQNINPAELLEKYKQKQSDIEGYISAYREYSWKVSSTDDFKVAPFHLLACEGRNFSSETHTWHMETLRSYFTETDPLFINTEYISVDTSNPQSVQAGIEWWTEVTSNGGEGMVVKPENFIARNGSGLIQPAIKCRGSEYLRIIYGPDYLQSDHLTRLKKRSLSRKRSLALREFSLGMESLDRFVANKPLYSVHECVFGILALESEPVDPRL